MSFPSDWTDYLESDEGWQERRQQRWRTQGTRRGGAPEPWLPQRDANDPREIEARRLLRSMPYEDYLQSNHWRWRRRRALWLAEGQCQRCFDHKHLQVHHVTEDAYKRRGCEEDSDLEVLCRACHEAEHGLG